ncbi:unnamed protein product [Rotaria socialis]|uniref:Uncharacterized protein n=2 Tax=Rotaria socialis TaxID=392032 RepID=A0A821G4D8_9BILA|nr:unnamed protein product [Rotaria socialis]CAF4502536.1 unnamed protein product [Rotaria socialis]CAF4658720.1 unnamed protein product [Rotaria socialis]
MALDFALDQDLVVESSYIENGLLTIKDRHKCYVGYCLFEESLPEVEAVAERLDNEMNTDLEPDCEAIVNNHKSHKQQGLGQPSILTTSNNSSIEMDRSTTMKNQKKVDAGNGFNSPLDSTIRSLATQVKKTTRKRPETALKR